MNQQNYQTNKQAKAAQDYGNAADKANAEALDREKEYNKSYVDYESENRKALNEMMGRY